MKVLMLGWELPPFNSGGLGEACRGLSCALARKGVDVTFVLPRDQDVYLEGVRIVFANVDEDIVSFRSAYTFSNEYARIFVRKDPPSDFVGAALAYARRIKKIIAKLGEVDIIHSHDWMTFPAALAAKRILQKPLVVHLHSTEFDRTGGLFPNPTVLDIERDGVLAADRVLPVGGFMKKVLTEKYGVDPSRVEVVYNGIDYHNERIYPLTLTSFKKMGYKIVLFLGRITLQKGPEYFVRAADKVLRYYPKVIFVVAGSGDMKSQMIAEAARLGILDKFMFAGFVRGDDRDRIYQCADLYVMPSVSEPFGISALEAAANNTPVLVSRQSGVAEIFRNSLKVDFWDIDEMSAKIISVLKYGCLGEVLRKEAAKEIKNFSWDRAADKVIQVYSSLL
jgi:glycosyltransferase involved in cell wall biosynthesis